MDFNQQEVINEVWRQYDPSMRKRLNINELRNVFLDMGRDISDKDLNACAKGNNNASLDMVVEYLNQLPKSTATSADIRASAVILSNFSSFGDRLKTTELRLTLCTQGDKLTRDEAAALIADCDDGYGYVDIDNFARVITQQ